MSKSYNINRLGNRSFIHLAASVFAKKFNLYIEYEDTNTMQRLGVPLFCGEKKYEKTVDVYDTNYLELYKKDTIDCNCNFRDYFQSREISKLSHAYLQSHIDTIITSNKYKDRYNNNNDCFVHIRLGDVTHYNPGITYYTSILSTLKVDTIYISTDSNDHPIIQTLLSMYSNIQLLQYSLIDTILFGSTNKYIMCSHGTYSGIISYLSFYSTVYFIKESKETAWDYFGGNGMFDIFKDHSSMIHQYIEVDTKNLPSV